MIKDVHSTIDPALLGRPTHFARREPLCLGILFSIFRHVAVSDQHRDVYRDVPDCISDRKHPESRVESLKLDELIRALKTARTELMQMEAPTDQELDEIQKELQLRRDLAVNN
jgi:hypothetical protein